MMNIQFAFFVGYILRCHYFTPVLSYSPTPQVVHSNSSCPSHSEQVGWQRTHWLFSMNCPLGQGDEALHAINPTQRRKIRKAATDLMAAPEDFDWKTAERRAVRGCLR